MEKSKTENKQPKVKKSLSSNPIDARATGSNAKATVETAAQAVAENFTNPLVEKTNSIVAKINNFNSFRTNSRMYPMTSPIATTNKNVDYADLLQDLNNDFRNFTTIHDLFIAINKTFTEKMDSNFTAFGLFHEKSKCINMKLYSKRGEAYSSKIFMSDDTNPVIECFQRVTPISKEDINFLNLPYMQNSPAYIMPMVSVNKCIGVMLI